MSKGGSGQVQETAQQRALADYALNQLQDYKARWLPVQGQLAKQIQALAAPNSAERDRVEGRASTDNAIAFSQAQGALEKSLSNKGVNPGSSRAKLATTGMGEDIAKTNAMAGVISDQQIDDAYTKGLMSLTAIGRGEKAMVGDSLAAQANESARTAAGSAEASVINRSGDASLVGTAAGFGLQRAFGSPYAPNVPANGLTGGSRTALGAQPDGFTTNPQAGP